MMASARRRTAQRKRWLPLAAMAGRADPPAAGGQRCVAVFTLLTVPDYLGRIYRICCQPAEAGGSRPAPVAAGSVRKAATVRNTRWRCGVIGRGKGRLSTPSRIAGPTIFTFQRHGVLCAMALRVSRSGGDCARPSLWLRHWQGMPGPMKARSGDLRPDGSLIYLIEAGDDIYARDFHLHDARRCATIIAASIIWHWGMEAESRDNWIIFSRTVFGFTLEHEQTLPDPYGLVRSPAVHSPQGNIRLCLEYLPEPRHPDCPVGGLLSGAGLQRGVCLPSSPAGNPRRPAEVSRQALPIPANYYDDLLARYGEAVMSRRCNVCTFSSMTAIARREFLHLIPDPFSAGALFLELTERRDGYACTVQQMPPFACRQCNTASNVSNGSLSTTSSKQ